MEEFRPYFENFEMYSGKALVIGIVLRTVFSPDRKQENRCSRMFSVLTNILYFDMRERKKYCLVLA